MHSGNEETLVRTTARRNRQQQRHHGDRPKEMNRGIKQASATNEEKHKRKTRSAPPAAGRARPPSFTSLATEPAPTPHHSPQQQCLKTARQEATQPYSKRQKNRDLHTTTRNNATTYNRK
ncbi:hypothetical protein AVEN_261898-1 [Araneus ventricosus]|uniref:Uncharacterized protein n=1 Tax=Araneus ventricosus TaxID=182803 RepID=A0A4Y2KS14_ARAVE|nr:hypothetical protein AVEN_261898-1 [Araneus ventricosus]